MLLPFRRVPRPLPQGQPAPLVPTPDTAPRAWMVAALLSTLSPQVRQVLAPWLLAPTDPQRWPPPETFSTRRPRLRPEEFWDQPQATACRLLREELRAICYTLALPPEAISGLARNGLLAAHAIRLRQLEWRLWPRFAARALRQMLE
jgi:hypothetical protein